MNEQRIGPFVFSGFDQFNFDLLLKRCLNSIKPASVNSEDGNQDSIIPGEITQHFRNLTINGDAKIKFPDNQRNVTLNIIVEENFEFKEAASLKTNVNLKIRAATAIGDVNIKSFGTKDGEIGEHRTGKADSGRDGANEGEAGDHGGSATGTDGDDGEKGDTGIPGNSGRKGGPGGKGEPGRSIYLFVDRFQFGSSVVLTSKGSNGASGGNGQDGGDGGNGRNGGRGGDGGDGGWLHRAGNAGRGGDGGDGSKGGTGGNSGRNGTGGNGGDLTVIVVEPENIPWIGVVKSIPGDGGESNFSAPGNGGAPGVAGKGGQPGNRGYNSKPGRSNGKPNVRGSDGWAPRRYADNGRPRAPGERGQEGREDGPRPAVRSDLIEFFSEIVEEIINV